MTVHQPSSRPAASRQAVGAFIYGIFDKVLCIDCDYTLDDVYGKVSCDNCLTKYMIRRIVEATESNPIFFRGEGDRKSVTLWVEPRTWHPLPNHKVIQYLDTDDEVDTNHHEYCVLCKGRMESILSARVRITRFQEYDSPEVAVTGVPYIETRVRPTFSTGTAHISCAESPKYKGLVEVLRDVINTSKEGVRTVPLSRFGTMNHHDKWKDKARPSGDASAFVEVDDML